MSEVLQISQEFINIGGSKILGVELLTKVEELCIRVRDKGVTLSQSDYNAITEIIIKRTNLNFKPLVTDTLTMGVLINEPVGHSGISNFHGDRSTSGKNTEFYDKWMSSTIDLDKVKVTGQFEKVSFYLVLPEADFSGKTGLTPEEITAFILHEVGHAFFSLATLGEYVYLNYYLTDGADVLLGKKPNKYKIDVFDAAYLKKELPKEEVERLVKDPTEANYRRALLIAHRRSPRTHLVSKAGSEKRDEQLADMFASRMGFSRHLATGFYKLKKSPSGRFYRGTAYHTAIEIVKLLFGGFAVAGSLTVPLASPILLYAYVAMEFGDSSNGGVYDNDYQRLVKIRQDLIAQLKHASSNPTSRAIIDDDIKVVDNLLKTMKDRTTLVMAMMYLLIPGYRRSRQQLKHEELLESLLNNDLFLQADRFRR